MLFHCIDCDTDKTHENPHGFGGTGYATTDKGAVCYACCALRDVAHMVDLVAQVDAGLPVKSFCLYAVTAGNGCVLHVRNWPGTLSFVARSVTRSTEYRRGDRISVCRFTFVDNSGRQWKGITRGDTHIARCKPVSVYRKNRKSSVWH
jgi:hypothetical protein